MIYIAKLDHTPRVHSQSPHSELPSSFAAYRMKAQTHGPLGGKGKIDAGPGEYFSRTELPKRLHYNNFTDLEMETINSGGAEAFIN